MKKARISFIILILLSVVAFAALPGASAETEPAVYRLIPYMEQSDAVFDVQTALLRLGYLGKGSDFTLGIFDDATLKALRLFCEDNHIALPAEGISPEIQKYLLEKSPSPRAASEEGALTRLFFMRGGYMAPLSYEVTLTGDGYVIAENEGRPRPLDPSLAAEMIRVVEECGMKRWDGFRGSNPYVLDGESFSLTMEFSDGTTVYASGENSFPDGYGEASARLDEIFEKAAMSRLAGVYRYEGEGFGGDFTLTLNADGSYTFYEGPLSSYMGGGTWRVYLNAVDLNEENGFELSFTFGVEEGALIYLSGSSDPFPYVKVKDRERFVRTESEEESMKLFIDGTPVPVTWENNESVTALRGLLPLEVSMSMYGGFEQVGPLGRGLPRDDRQTVTAPGDIVLYSGNQIVVFYGSNSWAYTPLGHINLSPGEMAGLLSGGDVVLTVTE